MRALALFAIGLVFGGGIGFTVAASQGVTLDGHDHDAPMEQGNTAAHGAHGAHGDLLEVPAVSAPAIEVEVTADPVAGYNLRVATQNFKFAPRRAGLENEPGRGHAHVYLNGQKLARLYGRWMHLASLPRGDVEIEVTLNANDHRTLAVEGEKIASSAIVIVE